MTRPTKATLVLCALAGALAPPEAPIVFGPEEDLELSKRFETRLEFGVDDFVLRLQGAEVPIKFNGRTPDEFEGVAEYVLATSDVYGPTGGGRPLSVTRTFEELGASLATSFDNDASVEADEFVGESVRFAWDSDTEQYVRSFESDGGADEALLELLDEDLDLRALLPPQADVTDGEAWEVPWSRLSSLATPGLHADAMAGRPPFAAISADLVDAIAEAFAGDVVLCTRGADREDGLVAIAIESEAGGDVDSAPLIELLASLDLGGMQVEMLELSAELELSGELLWSAEHGHFDSLELDGDLILYLDFDLSFQNDAQPVELDGEAEVSCSIERRARAIR